MAREQLGAAPSIAAHATTKSYTDSSFYKSGGITTLTTPTTLAAAANTEYIYHCSFASTDPYWASTLALYHFDGTNGVAGPFPDSAINNTINAGSALYTGGTACKYNTTTKKFGTASMYYDGSQKAGLYTDSACAFNWNFGTGDWTVEFQVNFPNAAGGGIIMDWRPNATGAFPTIYFTGSTIRYYVNGQDYLTSTTISSNTWYHVAICKASGTTRMYLNGTQVGTVQSPNMSDSFNYSGGTPLIAQSGIQLDGAGSAFYMDELRVTNAARYTSNFTAPTAAFPEATYGIPTLPTAVGNTSSYILTNSNYNGYITVGTTSAQTINGQASLALPPNSSTRIVSDGSNWKALGQPNTMASVINADDSRPQWLYNKALNSPKVTRILDPGGNECARFVNGTTAFDTGNLYNGARMYVYNINHGAEFRTNATDGGWFSAYFTRYASTGSFCGFYYGSGYTYVGSISTNGSSTSFNTTSDHRLKENIADLVGGLDAACALRPVTFTWRYGDKDDDEGFLAHEVAEVLPHVVKGEKDAVDADGKMVPQTVDYAKIIPTLTAAVQELKAELDAAKARIAQLEGNTNG